MKSGPLRRVLRHQSATSTTDALGQVTPSWQTVSTFRGEVRAPRGAEATVALQARAFVSVVIECRYPGAPFGAADRIVDVTEGTPGRVYNVVSSVDPDGRRRRLVTMATEVTTAADDAANL